ncbi:Hypothetical protein SCF082_LOCUS50511 [Durusdinium trenchii]|uniref:Uncharacterized protein n=1 Tax=Durusdinium trenchii TaxID=1381693 RepID=A0ABP0S8H0_9DINO
MEYTPRGRVPVSEPISPVAQRVALSGPASEPGGAGVASSREGWPWQFQLNPRRSEERPLTATRKASPVATQLRALSGGRGQVVNATARASYETAVIAAVRRQCDIFEEKWEKKLRQDRKDSTTGPSLDRLFDRVNALEAQQPRVEKRLAELDGKVKGLSDELQAQIRQVHLLDDRRWEWKQKLEEELANKCQALQQQMQALLSSSRTLSLEEESKQQRSWNTALEDGLKAAARERLAMQEEVHEGFVNVCERLAALEVQQIQEASLEKVTMGAAPSDVIVAEVTSKRLEDLEKRFEEALQDNFDIHQRHAAQEEQIRTLRTRFETREEQLRDLGERVERSDWDVKLTQIRQALQEDSQQRTLQNEQLELLTKRLEYQEQLVEDARFAVREMPAEMIEPVAVEEFDVAASIALLEDQVKGLATEIKGLQELREDQLGLKPLVMQLKEISPKIIEHERCIRRLEDSQQKAQVEDAVAQRGVNELKERMDELIETHVKVNAEQLPQLRQDMANDIRDHRQRMEESLKELSAEVQRGTSSLLEDFKEEKSKELRQELLGLQDFRRSMEATMKDEAREVEQEAQLKKLKVLEAQLTETKAQLSSEEASIERIEALSALSVATRDAVGVLEKDLSAIKEHLDQANGEDAIQSLQLQVTSLSERLSAFVAAQLRGHDHVQPELAVLAEALRKDEEEEQAAHARLLLRIDELCSHLSKASEAPPWVKLEVLGRQVEEMQQAEKQMEAKLESFVANAAL